MHNTTATYADGVVVEGQKTRYRFLIAPLSLSSSRAHRLAQETKFVVRSFAIQKKEAGGLDASMVRHDEHEDETHYDDRSDADDDLEKGKIQFSKQLYGREKELDHLQEVYRRIVVATTLNSSSSHSIKENAETITVRSSEEEEDNVDALAEGDQDCGAGMSQVVFLSAYPGTGKSALVGEFVKRLQENALSSPLLVSPRFISGKYDELLSSESYSALSDGLGQYFGRLLTSKDEIDQKETTVLKTALKHALGGSGNVLAGIIPHLAEFLERPEEELLEVEAGTPALTSSSSMIRFSHPTEGFTMIKHMFRNLIGALCTKKRPMILFLKNLQWVDEASLDLISALLSDVTLKYFMFVGAYRSNEVKDDHPVWALMKELEESRKKQPHGGGVERLVLKDLSVDHIGEFITDSLDFDSVGEALPLTQAIFSKTLGNIFFTIQAMEELVRKNGIYYDIMVFKWRWNLDCSEMENLLSDDVLDMVKAKLSNLPGSVQHMLAVASFTRSTFDVNTLNELVMATNGATSLGNEINYSINEELQVMRKELVRGLNRAVEEELLVIRYNNVPTKKKRASTNSPANSVYSFAQDRIQKASQLIVKGDGRNQIKFGIANVLCARHKTRHGEDWMLFTAVRHMNSLPQETYFLGKEGAVYLAKVNLQAAVLAIKRSGFRQAADLLRAGVASLVRVMADTMWEEQYDLCLDLFNNVLKTEATIGNFDAAQSAVEKVLLYAKSKQDILLAQYHEIEILTSGNSDASYARAMERGVEHLASHGIELKLSPSDSRVLKERLKLQVIMGRRSLQDFLDLPMMDEYDEQIMRLISQLSMNAIYAGNTQLSTVINLFAQRYSWEKGINKHMPCMLPQYGVLLRQQGKLKDACKVGLEAAEMIKRICEGPSWVRGMYVCLAGVNTIKVSYSSVIDASIDVHRVGILCGDCQWAINSAMVGCLSYYCSGWPLSSLFEAKLILFTEQATAYGLSPSSIVTFKVFRQALMNLKGMDSNDPVFLKGKALDEEKALAEFDGSDYKQALRDIGIFRLMLACIYGNMETMEEMVDRLALYPEFDLCIPRQHLRDVFMGLAAFWLARKGEGKRKDAKKYLKIGRDKLQWFQKLVKVESENALPIVLCLLAEETPTLGNYDKAIGACSKAGLLHLLAIMSERCGQFHFEKNNAEEGDLCLRKSMWQYHDWGAMGKVKEMQRKHGCLQGGRRDVQPSTSTGYATSQFFGLDAYSSNSSELTISGVFNISSK
jgi:predicted ATPase